MCITTRLAIIQDYPVIRRVPVLWLRTSAKSFAIVVLIVPNVSLAVGVKLNATLSSVLAIWLSENAILIYAKLVEQVGTTYSFMYIYIYIISYYNIIYLSFWSNSLIKPVKYIPYDDKPTAFIFMKTK